MAAQALDDFDTLADRRAEMLQTHRKVALINIIRTDPDFHQAAYQSLHRAHRVVDPAEQHALVAQGDTRIGQTGASRRTFLGDFVRMVEVRVEPDWMVFLEHVDQLWRDTLRANHRHAASDTDHFHMLDSTQTLDDVFQFGVRYQQGIAP